MTEPRLTAGFWVAAYLGRLRLADIPAFITAKGDATAGAVIVKLNTLDGRARAFHRSWTLEGARVWAVLAERPEAEVDAALARVERTVGRRFGDGADPLLVSVRSGARVSMPGMMDTVLNLGLNARTVEGLARASGIPRFAWDAYRRFVGMYSDVVLGLKAFYATN